MSSKFHFKVSGMEGFTKSPGTKHYAKGGFHDMGHDAHVGATKSEKGKRAYKGVESDKAGHTLGEHKHEGAKTTPKPFKDGGTVRYHFKDGGFIEKPARATRHEVGKRTNKGVESDKPGASQGIPKHEGKKTTPKPFAVGGHAAGCSCGMCRGGAMAKGGKIGHIKKGALHKELGVPEGKKLTSKELSKAKHSESPLERKRATFAENAKHWDHKAKGGKHSDEAEDRKLIHKLVKSAYLKKENGGKVYAPGPDNDRHALDGAHEGADQSEMYGRAYPTEGALNRGSGDLSIHKAAGGSIRDRDVGQRPMNAGSYRVTPPGQKVRNGKAAESKFTAKPHAPFTHQDGDQEEASQWSDFAMGGMAMGHGHSPKQNAMLHARGHGMPPLGGMGGQQMGGPGGMPVGGPPRPAAPPAGMGGPPGAPPGGLPMGGMRPPMGGGMPPMGGPPMMHNRGGRHRY
jgi:hypothetical protein